MRIQLIALFCIVVVAACTQNKPNLLDKKYKYTNELIHETSPYLLQHAHNPVNWRAWNDETLELAKKENKLMIISIGYAACHWCHVMEHESFEDEEVAELMNTHFIPVKIDREERPDIDDIYMTACNLITGRGGWPLNAIAMPDTRPVFAGTYYPKSEWMKILNQMIDVKEKDVARLEEAADNITQGIASSDVVEIRGEVAYDREILDDVVNDLLSRVDYVHGGNDRTPRFPMPNNFELILKYHKLNKDDKSAKAVRQTLDGMANGGIYDQIGGGFARYSVDGVWKVPHFEKMLYDNGQLIGLYADAFKQFQDPYYEKIARQSIEFIEREMSDETGGFYSSLDADSEGEEGKFYVWDASDIDSLLGENADIYKSYFSVTKGGNWEHSNILHITKEASKIAAKFNIELSELERIIDDGNRTLFAERSKRIRPGLDDKILCSWNALMIDGLLRSYEAFGEKDYYNRAKKCLDFILTSMKKEDGSLFRNFKNGKASISGFLDDYAILIDALIKMYQCDFDQKWLMEAEQLTLYVLNNFENPNQALFYYTSVKDTPLIVRKSEYADNVVPASNSIMAHNLFKLGSLLYKTDWVDLSKNMVSLMQNELIQERASSFYSHWIQLYLSFTETPYEIAIVGKDSEQLRRQLAKEYHGNALILGSSNDSELPLLKDKFQEGETFIYVCQNKTCKFPVSTVEKALELMQ